MISVFHWSSSTSIYRCELFAGAEQLIQQHKYKKDKFIQVDSYYLNHIFLIDFLCSLYKF